MAWHTIQEAQKLTGKSRRTLYRDMAGGRLSWESEADLTRRLETSELIRVYGALKPLAQPTADNSAHAVTGNVTPDTVLIMAELKALREEVADLRQAMRLIEHKPDAQSVLTQHDPSNELARDDVPSTKKNSWWGSLFKGLLEK